MTRHLATLWAWFFPLPRTADLIRDQLGDAQREALMHAAAAEHHRALQEMYEGRCQRLQGLLTATTGANP
jgi:hypothetical protein